MKKLINALKAISPFMMSLNIIMVGLTLSLSHLAKAGPSAAASQKSFTFEYKMSPKSTFKIQKLALTHDEAFKLAAKDCFNKLTGGKYPGEEKGLNYIDICANPKSSL